MKITKAHLMATAKDLNAVIQPEDKPFIVAAKQTSEEIQEWINEAVTVLEPEDEAELNSATVSVLKEMGLTDWMGDKSAEKKKAEKPAEKKSAEKKVENPAIKPAIKPATKPTTKPVEKKVIEMTVLGHRKGTIAGNMDDFIIKNKGKKLTALMLIDNVPGCKPYRANGYAKYLKEEKAISITINDDKTFVYNG